MHPGTDTAWLLHLLSVLKRAARRSLFVSGFCSVFFPSALLYAVFIFIHLTVVPVPLLIYCLPPLAAFSFALFRVLCAAPAAGRILYKTDQVFELKSRLLTAFSISRSSHPISVMEKLQLDSARRSLSTIRPSAVFPLHPGIPKILIFFPVFLCAFSIVAALLMNNLVEDGDGRIAVSARQLESAAKKAAELTPEDEMANHELLERIEALGRRLSERQMEEREAVLHSLQLQEDLQTRIEELERDLLAQSVEPDRQVKVPDTPELALRRSEAPRGSDLAAGGESLAIPSDSGTGAESSGRIESYQNTLNALENLSNQFEEAEETGPSVIGQNTETASGSSMREDLRSSGRERASPGSAADEDRFKAEFGELPDSSDMELSLLRGRNSGDADASIVTRTYSEPGEARLPFIDPDTEYEPGLEQVISVQSIHPDDRDLALSYLYAIGMSEGDTDE